MQGKRITMALLACAIMSPQAVSPVQGQTRAEADAQAPQAAYFVEENGAAAGPLPFEALAARVAAGTLQRSTLVWTDGQENWVAAGEHDTLAGLFAAGDPNRDVNIDLPGFFLGRWVQEGVVPFPGGAQGIARITTDYRSDQTFALTGSIDTAATTAALTLSGEGVWDVVPLEGTGFDVKVAGLLRMQGAGQPAASRLLNQQSRLEIVGRDTLRNLDTGELLRRVTP